MSNSLWGLKSVSGASQGRFWANLAILLSMGLVIFLTGSMLFVQAGDYKMLSAGRSAADSAQVQGMAGYVLNSETNMNTVYTRKLNRELMNPPNPSLDDGPLIQYVGPPPQPPVNEPPFRPYQK